MVKGISRQVIVVHSPDKKLFEQAIFILKDDAGAVSDDMLMKEAKRLIGAQRPAKRFAPQLLWTCSGALLTGLIWFLTILL